MRTPQEIYTAYKIMPSLQLHQLRVAALGKLICDNFTQPINERDVVLECLFHDMGNIVKSNLSYFSDFTEPEGVEYWERIKAEFIAKYGAEQHTVNAAIAHEIGLSEPIIEIMNKTGFSRLPQIVESPSLELKVCQYADTRVGPRGVLPLSERIEEGRKRYVVRAQKENLPDRGHIFETAVSAAKELEGQLFAHTKIKPEDINDTSVAPVIEELRAYPVV